MYTRSENIDLLATALAAAQGIMEGAAKDSANPFFKSNYADLASVWDAIRQPLASHGLSVVQMPIADGPRVTVTTLLMHTSGQWISSDLTITAKEDSPQAVGSAITYARRYALQSVAGVAPEDDDGERAQGRTTQTQRKTTGNPTEQETLLLIRDTLTKLRKQFEAAGGVVHFDEALGSFGFEKITDVPANRERASELVKELKLRLSDIVAIKR
jgi:hypothetical protein